MESHEQQSQTRVGGKGQPDKWYSPLTRVTPLSKYLAMALFVVLPFVGFWLGVGYGEQHQLHYETNGVARSSIDVTQQVTAIEIVENESSIVAEEEDALSLSDFDPWTYDNDKYGFSLQLPNLIKPEWVYEDSVSKQIVLAIEGDTGAIMPAEGAVLEEVIRIYPVPKDEFKSDYQVNVFGNEDDIFYAIKPRGEDVEFHPWLYVGQNNKFVFMLSHGNDCGGDACVLLFLEKEIVSTFDVPSSGDFVVIGTVQNPPGDLLE